MPSVIERIRNIKAIQILIIQYLPNYKKETLNKIKKEQNGKF